MKKNPFYFSQFGLDRYDVVFSTAKQED